MTDPIDNKILRLEQTLNQIKVHFEMFISGRERIPPMKKIDDFELSLNRLALEANKRTASRFRLTNLRSKFTSLKSLWMRQLDRKEMGRSVNSARPTSTKSPTKDTKPSLHQEYNSALKELGDSRRISEEQLSATLKTQREKLASKYPGKEFDFKVSIRDGKVRLKALPK